ncbi:MULTISPECIES: hypothetical protein [Exiguobacterium]|uniref:YtkA-like domain-containing protein n=1 Tax=Exiguobacterium antarcticum TaxID=132920 RepID=A0ABT6R615_9BACL|nr:MULTISPECIES: hypothetical protein [Exiguobacterium]AFS69432.1 Hypothetical protein Eab7_0270 [Exiguobacterium antarcticum B7]MCT4779902.1 hypothetical protein [Exiguobacterium soli]MDI3236372.1 hypothetical protein [Exiguobacterium antarcticum]
MKRLFMTSIVVSSVVLLAGCQFETKAAPPMMKVGLYAPEKIAADTRTTVAVEIENPQDIEIVHVQVTPIGSDDTETFEAENKDGHYVSSIPFKKAGVYVVNGMVHVGDQLYTPKSLIQVGDVSEAELEQAQATYHSQAPATSSGQHHH